ncbi:MAG: Do family serine endopeptidase [Pseudomonadota bacterium]
MHQKHLYLTKRHLHRLAGGVALASSVAAASASHADEALADLVEDVAPSVVTILADRDIGKVSGGENDLRRDQSPFFEEFFRRFGDSDELLDKFKNDTPRPALGSGFILEEDGLIVTNQHVIEDAREVTVRLHDDREFDAEVIGADPETDLALLSIKVDEALPFVELGDSDDIRVGEDVVAVGNPFGLGGSVTSGIISAKGRNIGAGPYAEFLQTDAAINRGNSGGPLFNMDGEVVGVNSAIFSPTGGNVGIGFAVTSNIVDLIVSDLRDDGSVERGWLGVSIQTMSPEIAAAIGLEDRKGALVSGVVSGGPSDGTLEIGDVILSFDGKTVADARDLPRLVGAADVNGTSDVDIIRDGDRQTLEIEIGQYNDVTADAPTETLEKPSSAKLGVTVAPLTETARSEIGVDDDATGVVVTSLAPSGAAASAGLQVGDVIVQYGDQPVSNPESLREAVQSDDREAVLVLLNRRGQQIFVAVEPV